MPHNTKVLLGHSGRCLSPRLLMGFSGAHVDGVKDLQLDEDVILDFIRSDEAASLLQVRMPRAALPKDGSIYFQAPS